jgi:hypothetical protein
MKSTLCDRQIASFFICLSCGKSYCEQHQVSTCQFCKGMTSEASASLEVRFNSWDVNWVAVGQSRVGLVGFEEIPGICVRVVLFLKETKIATPFEVILFPTKELSEKFKSSIARDSPFRSFILKKVPKESRYSVIFDPTRGVRSVLLNVSAIEPNLITFLLQLVLDEAYAELSQEAGFGLQDIGDTLLGAFKEYNSRLGIPFVSWNEKTKQQLSITVNNLNTSYTFYKVLGRIISEDNLDQAETFVLKHIELIFGDVDWEVIHLLDETLSLMLRIIDALTVVVGSSVHVALRSRVNAKFQRHLEDVEKGLGEFPDTIEALKHVVSKFSNLNVFASRRSYVRASCESLLESVKLLGPHYDRMDETLDLARAERKFANRLERGEEPTDPEFGSLNEFLRLLTRIFEMSPTYPEIAIRAGSWLLNLLETLMLSQYDYLSYRSGLAVARKLSRLLEENWKEIRRKNPESPYAREDQIAEPLLGVIGAAKTYQDPTELAALQKECREIVERHRILQLKSQLDWMDFLESQDFDYLLSIYKDFQAATTENISGVSDHANFLGHLASAIIGTKNREFHLEMARDFSSDMRTFHLDPIAGSRRISQTFESGPGLMAMSMAAHSGDLSLFFTELVAALLNLESNCDSPEKQKQLRISASILGEVISTEHPAYTFVLRTMCLCSLLERNKNTLEVDVVKLQTRSGTKPGTQDFLQLCKISASRDRVKSRLLQSLERHIDTRDPWNRIALKFVHSELSSQLRGIDLFDFDAIVLVEGQIDKRVFSKFAQKIAPNLRLLMIDVGGWGSMKYFADAKIAREAKLKVVVIFDGDTEARRSSDVKRRLLLDLGVKPRIVTLKRNSIEDYLLIPRAICAAFPSQSLDESRIGSFLRQSKKRNKKEVLDLLIRKLAGVKYNSRIAATIANRMTFAEIDPEIRQIFSNL